jgi:hypothetical protein
LKSAIRHRQIAGVLDRAAKFGRSSILPHSSEYLPEVLGGEMADTSDLSGLDEATEILALPMRRWNDIVTMLNRYKKCCAGQRLTECLLPDPFGCIRQEWHVQRHLREPHQTNFGYSDCGFSPSYAEHISTGLGF